MPQRRKQAPVTTTVTRRDLLEWLGRGTLLALSAAALKACGVTDIVAAGPLRDALDAGAAHPDAGAEDASVGQGFTFAPGPSDAETGLVFPERTVDDQNIDEILASWQLRVDGMVAQPVSFSFADLLALPRQSMVTDFHCVEGWTVQDVPWDGVHLSEIFEIVQPLAEAAYLTFYSVGGVYKESLPIEVALEHRSLIGYGINGNTLPLSHGFPARMVVPRLWGYKNPKYVMRIELTDQPIEGFWVQAGYGYGGEVSPGRLREGKY